MSQNKLSLSKIISYEKVMLCSKKKPWLPPSLKQDANKSKPSFKETEGEKEVGEGNNMFFSSF